MFRLGSKKTEASPGERFPVIKDNFGSSIPALFIIGDLTGIPLLKFAINHGYEVIKQIADRGIKAGGPVEYDVVIIGAGAAGLSAAIEAHRRGMKYLVLEKEQIGNTLRNFPANKMIYAEPAHVETKGDLWLGEAVKEEFLPRWQKSVEELDLNVHEHEPVTGITKKEHFEVVTDRVAYTAASVVLAIGKQGNPRKLGVPGEDFDKVFSKLYNPHDFEGQNILIVGGGDSAVEAALSLADKNHVTISYRRSEFSRLRSRNLKLIEDATQAGKVTVVFNSSVKAIAPKHVVLGVNGQEQTISNDIVFTMIGTEMPVEFFQKIGLRLENEWDARRWLKFAGWSALIVLIYSVKKFNHGLFCSCPAHSENFSVAQITSELWDKAYAASHLWYPAIYSALVLVFGLYYILARRPSRYTRWRTISCMAFQIILFFLLPELLKEGNLYRLAYAWPLSMGAVFKPSHARFLSPEFWWIYGLALAFVGVPVLTYYHGKRYCSWICGCGAMAETAGDPFRRLAPKGPKAEKWGSAIYVVFASAVVVTLLRAFGGGDRADKLYELVVMWALAGWVAIAAYPFFGSRIWCRYACPLAAYMNLIGKINSRWQIGAVKGKCIDCGLCNMNCEMGIDIKRRAIRGEPVTLKDTPCVGCGECVRVCPMDCLYVGHVKDPEKAWKLPSNQDIIGIR